MAKNYNPQFIQAKLKLGWTTQDFLDYYGVTREEFAEFLGNHNTNPIYNSFWRDVSANERLARQRTKQKKTSSEDSLKEIEEDSTSFDSSEEFPLSPVRVVDPTTQKIEEFEREIELHEGRKKELTKTQSDLNNKIESAKKTIKTNMEQINSCNAELSDAQRTYENVKKRCEARVKLLVDGNSKEKDKITAYEEQLAQTSKDINTVDNYIADCKQLIRDFKKITVTVTNNYEIVIDKPFDYDDETDKFFDLIRKESISGRMYNYQLECCATLLSIMKALRNTDEVYEFVFAPDENKENESLKAFFELVVEKFL